VLCWDDKRRLVGPSSGAGVVLDLDATRVGFTGISFRVSLSTGIADWRAESLEVDSESAVAIERESIEVDFFAAFAVVGGAVNVGGSKEKSSIESEESFRVEASCFASMSEGARVIGSGFVVA
jgi:hypothetical protein